MSTSRLKFPRRVRIHGGECGAVARALHHAAQKDALMAHEWSILRQADGKKSFPSTFIERKYMSTKMTLKRVALVAVSALGLGLLASMPAKAATDAFDLTTAEYIAAGGESGAQVAGALNYVTFTGNLVAAVAATNWTFKVSGASATISAVTGAGLAISADKSSAASTVNTALTASIVTINTPAVGTVTVDVYKNVENAATGIWTTTLEETMTVTVRATATAGVASTATATITAGSTHAAGGTTDGTILPVARAVGNQAAVIEVVVKDVNAAQVVGAVITASITGAGQLGSSDDETAVGVNTTAATGRSVSVTTAGAGDGTGYITVWSDGTSGVGTITVTAAGTTFTKSVTFYGALASLKATASKKVYSQDVTAAANVGAADTYGVLLQGLDAAGVEVPLTAGTVTVTSADTNEFESAAAQGTVSNDTGLTNQLLVTVDVDTVNRVGGKPTVMTYTIGTITTTATLTAGKDAAAGGTQVVTMTTDKTTYLPGEKVTITVTGKDSSGSALGDGAQALFTAAPTTNIALSAVPVASPVLSAGVATYTTYAPFLAGTVVISATANNAAASAVTASFDVTGGSLSDAANAAADAAAEAIDAANAATDAATLAEEAADAATVAAEEARDAADAATAAVEELATQVATLMAALKAQLTTLANTVAKIAKKVKA